MVPTTSTVHRLSRADLAGFDDTDLTRAHVSTNAHVAHAHERGDVLPALIKTTFANVLHEMIARRVREDHPDAVYLRVDGGVVTHCLDADNHVATWCTGHPTLLTATEILDADGDPIAHVDPYSPIQWWLERLTPESAHAHYLIDIDTRDIINEGHPLS